MINTWSRGSIYSQFSISSCFSCTIYLKHRRLYLRFKQLYLMFKLNYDFIVPYFIDLHVQCIIIKVVPFLHWSGKQDCDWIGYTVEINVIVINEIHVILLQICLKFYTCICIYCTHCWLNTLIYAINYWYAYFPKFLV